MELYCLGFQAELKDIMTVSSGNFTQQTFQESSRRRQWLTSAIQEMQSNDPVKVMMENLKTLGEDVNIEVKEDILEDLKEYCEDIDLACTFHKIGGFAFTTQFLKGRQTGLKWRSADLVATIVQQNPECQKVVLDLHYIPLLIKLVEAQESDDLVRIKALYALSCTTRDFTEGQDVLLANDGFSVILRAMQSNLEKLQTKAAFLLTALCQTQPKFKDILCDMGMVDQLVGMLQTEHSAFHEHLMSALLEMVHDHPRSKTECQKPQLMLKQTLESRIDYLANKEEYMEEYEYAKQLLKICLLDAVNSVER